MRIGVYCHQRKGVIQLNARFTHTVPDDLNEKIEGIAEQKGMTKTAFINMVMADYVGAHEDPGFFNEVRTRIEKIEKELEELKNKPNT